MTTNPNEKGGHPKNQIDSHINTHRHTSVTGIPQGDPPAASLFARPLKLMAWATAQQRSAAARRCARAGPPRLLSHRLSQRCGGCGVASSYYCSVGATTLSYCCSVALSDCCSVAALRRRTVAAVAAAAFCGAPLQRLRTFPPCSARALSRLQRQRTRAQTNTQTNTQTNKQTNKRQAANGAQSQTNKPGSAMSCRKVLTSVVEYRGVL